MEIKNYSTVSNSFYKVVHAEATIEELISAIKAADLSVPEKYAYQAFCYAMMAKEATGLLQKGKYIQQYGEFIGKSIVIKSDCYEARLMRFIVEKRLTEVEFVSHKQVDMEFLAANVSSIKDDCLKHITLKALANV
ncbi:MAG TPA: hypothetical protein VFS25_05115 [Chitinophaga sp.]|uniref:hypothetical protein n=1 Tax=Chitinophaga sp. TaxID=1869181 RepID=UPI002DB6B761|nr:hypothetical protein [Chitinophaga sp.]HEU4552188.1 hypothetical protein [Chitinophaga sp.]